MRGVLLITQFDWIVLPLMAGVTSDFIFSELPSRPPSVYILPFWTASPPQNIRDAGIFLHRLSNPFLFQWQLRAEMVPLVDVPRHLRPTPWRKAQEV